MTTEIKKIVTKFLKFFTANYDGILICTTIANLQSFDGITSFHVAKNMILSREVAGIFEESKLNAKVVLPFVDMKFTSTQQSEIFIKI